VAELLDPWQPALLQLIAACASAGTAAGKPVGVCGEAGRRSGACRGADRPGDHQPVDGGRGRSPRCARRWATRTLADCRAAARAVLAAPDAAAARAAVLG
jgi:phosphotransferase system enzyme I (PtsI)